MQADAGVTCEGAVVRRDAYGTRQGEEPKSSDAIEHRGLMLAIVNEGKPSPARSFILSGWLRDRVVNIAFISEAALSGRAELSTDCCMQ